MPFPGQDHKQAGADAVSMPIRGQDEDGQVDGLWSPSKSGDVARFIGIYNYIYIYGYMVVITIDSRQWERGNGQQAIGNWQ